jgi:hypothetical protein
MSAELKKEIELEIAYVLFLDIVGYSKLSVNEQHARADELNGIVRLSEQFQKAEARRKGTRRSRKIVKAIDASFCSSLNVFKSSSLILRSSTGRFPQEVFLGNI